MARSGLSGTALGWLEVVRRLCERRTGLGGLGGREVGCMSQGASGGGGVLRG